MLILLLLICATTASYANRVGSGFAMSEFVDYERNWNSDLGEEPPPPMLHLEKPYWISHRQKHLDALGLPSKKQADPLAMAKRGFALKALVADTGRWDQILGYTLNGVTGPDTAIQFDTKGLAWEISQNARIGGYRSRLSWLRFDDEEVISLPTSANGYSLTFGSRSSEVSALSDTDLNLVAATNEREVYQGHGGRISFLQGVNYLDLRRFERIRGQDRLGLNSNRIPRDPLDPNGVSDAVIIEQGEDRIKSSGPGVVLGLRYQQEIYDRLSLNTSLSLSLLNLQTDQNLLIDQISTAGIRRSLRQLQSGKRNWSPVVDFELELQRYVRKNFSTILGLRYIHLGIEHQSSLAGGKREAFTLRGLQAGFRYHF